MAIQIGKYKRPGIFIEEFDNSVITSPIVEGITNTIIGVSKKGPVNTPILVRTLSELESFFGPLDRQLERKGSFFHRTISKMLETSPVFAINLLLTDDVLDQLEYQSLSCATTVQNDIERLAPYRRFFDTTGFWKRDTDSFINITKDTTYGAPGWEKRLLNFTNLSDKYVTIFVFKSQRTGFDRSLLEWYGSVEKLPPYVYPTDLASDYLVDVVVIAGDYSDYRNLSIDPRFAQYFSPTGLRKDQVRNFSNDRNVTTLAYAEGLSLIPYFRDLNGQNIFIETVINRGTDQHGIFCSFNTDIFETDYPNGLVDLIGNNFVGDMLAANPPTSNFTNYGELDKNDGTSDGEVKINFLSYQETITESIPFTSVVLDRPGNVMFLGTQSPIDSHSYKSGDMTQEGGILQGYVNDTERTYWFAEGYVNDTFRSSFTWSGATISVVYDVDATSQNGYAVIGGNYVSIKNTPSDPLGSSNLNGVINLSSTYYSSSLSRTQSYYAAFVLDTTGTIKTVQTPVGANVGSLSDVNKPLVGASDIVLGYASFSCYAGNFDTTSVSIVDVTVNDNGGSGASSFVHLTYGTSPTDGFFYTINGSQSFTVTFPGTNKSITPRNYEEYRKIKTFNTMLDFINSSSSNRGVLLLDPLKTLNGYSEKLSLSFINVSNIRDVNTQNRSFTINLNIPVPSNLSTNVVVEDNYVDNYFASSQDVITLADPSNGLPLVFYKLDNEFILGTEGVETKSTKAGLTPDGLTFSKIGVAGRYSNFYSRFEDGVISATDVIYQKVNYSPVQVHFISGESITQSVAGFDYIVFGVNQNDVDYFGNTNTALIDRNEAFFNEVNVLSGYKFLMGGNLNSGVFTTKTDEGFNTTENIGFTFPPGFSSPLTAESRAELIGVLSNGKYGFTYSGVTYSYFAYEINENIKDEFLNSVSNVFSYNENLSDRPIYLEMYLDNELNLKCNFKDETLGSSVPFASIDTSGDSLWSNNSFFVKSYDSNFKQSVEIEEPAGYVTSPNKILVRGSRYTEVKIGDYLEAAYDETMLEPDQMPKKLTRILSKKTWPTDTTLVEITCDTEIKIATFNGDKQTFRYTKIDDYATTYKAISLKGFRIRQDSLPDGTESKQNAILNLVAKGTPLFNAITNKEAFDFRYLIDSFGLGLTERSKQQLVDICGERLDCFGILNMPSMKSFKNSSSPSFTNSEGVLQLEFVAKGGDPESNPAFLYTFGDGRGVSSVGYFTPYLTVNDNGRAVDVPPAAYVALTYMRKHNSTLTTIVPWTIAAGVTNGKITNISGLEMDFSPTDIEFLNQAQMNPIVFKRNRGYQIETENTAQTLFKSALSFIHVREVLIELERELSRMLLDFQWRFNTPDVRAEIKLRADVICERFVAQNGLFNYFNKCDDENNNSEIIDNQIGVLDTYVEPIKGMGIIVNNITILRTGAIQAGGFITP
jgi:hypothetical protein